MKKSTLTTLGLVVAAILAFGGTARGDEASNSTASNCSNEVSGCPVAMSAFHVKYTNAGTDLDNLRDNANRQVMVADLGFSTSGDLLDPLQDYWSSILGDLGCNNTSACAAGPGAPGRFPGSGGPSGPVGAGPGGSGGIGVGGAGGTGGMTTTPEPGTGTLALLGLAFMGLSCVLRRVHI